jgi:hypothetical protein
MSLSVAEALDKELTTGNATSRNDLVPPELQELLRAIVRSTGSKGTFEKSEAIRMRVAEIQADIERDLLDADKARRMTSELVQTLHRGLRREVMSAVASSKADPEFVSAFIQVQAHVLCVETAEQMGMTSRKAEAFVERQPMILRRFQAYVRHSLLLARYGPDSVVHARAKKELNNRLDIEYALTASYFDGLLTNDRRARDAYYDLRKMLNTPLTQARAALDLKLRELGLVH